MNRDSFLERPSQMLREIQLPLTTRWMGKPDVEAEVSTGSVYATTAANAHDGSMIR